MAVRDYAKFAPFLIITVMIILIVFIVITTISPSLQYPGKNIVDIVKGGVASILS